MNKYFLLIAALLIMTSTSCDKKDDNLINVSGSVNDPKLEQSVEGATVTLLAQTMVNGTWTTNYSKQAETVSDGDGRFNFELEFSYYPEFKLEIEKENYFDLSYEINSSEFENGTTFTKAFDIYPQGSINLQIINKYPVDTNDQISLHFKDWEEVCTGCCFSGFFKFTGDDVNEVYNCQIFGEEQYLLEYFVTKTEMGTQAYTREFFLPAFEQQTLLIEY